MLVQNRPLDFVRIGHILCKRAILLRGRNVTVRRLLQLLFTRYSLFLVFAEWSH